MDAAATWVDGLNGQQLTFNPQAALEGNHGYDPAAGETGFNGWLDRNSRTIAFGATVGVAAAATFLSGGVLAPEAGAAVMGAADLALEGAAGGAVFGFGSSYASGASAGQVAVSTVAGGLSTAAGVLAAPVGQSLFRTIQLSGIGEGLFAGGAGGFVYGGLEGAYNGYQQDHSFGGLAWGALSGGAEGALLGGTIGAGVGALSGRVCFVAGTQVLVPGEGTDPTLWEAKTRNIEDIRVGDYVLSRNENGTVAGS